MSTTGSKPVKAVPKGVHPGSVVDANISELARSKFVPDFIRDPTLLPKKPPVRRP